jgi:hypothetical protein
LLRVRGLRGQFRFEPVVKKQPGVRGLGQVIIVAGFEGGLARVVLQAGIAGELRGEPIASRQLFSASQVDCAIGIAGKDASSQGESRAKFVCWDRRNRSKSTASRRASSLPSARSTGLAAG